MKKLLVSLLVGAMVLMGCAGLIAKDPELLADYYVTKCTDEYWVTEEMPMEADVPVVVDTNTEADIELGIKVFWRDECNNAVANKYVGKEDGNEKCAIFYFTPDTFNLTMTAEYKSAQMVHMMPIECEVMDAAIAEQLENGPYPF